MRYGVFIVLLSIGHLGAASFDCGKARTTTEKLICSNAGLSKADEEMAAAYKKSRVASQAAPDDAKSIKEDQVAWLRERVASCEDRQCLIAAYKERNDALTFYTANLNSNAADAAAYTGTYRMGQSGTLEVVQRPKGSIKFSLNVVRVVNLSRGDVRAGDAAGDVPLKGSVAVYTDPDDAKCKITIVFGKTKAVVSKGDTCESMSWIDVSPDGTYMKAKNSVSGSL